MEKNSAVISRLKSNLFLWGFHEQKFGIINFFDFFSLPFLKNKPGRPSIHMLVLSFFRIIFDMCDDDKNGSIDKGELSELLNSLVDIAKTKRLSEDNVHALINSMFTSAGFESKESLNYEDFKTMMKEFKGDFLAIGKLFFKYIHNVSLF